MSRAVLFLSQLLTELVHSSVVVNNSILIMNHKYDKINGENAIFRILFLVLNTDASCMYDGHNECHPSCTVLNCKKWHTN